MIGKQWDVVVVGAGVAGLAAAAVTAAEGLATLCIDRFGPGGTLMNLGGVEDFPCLRPGTTGADFAAHLLGQCVDCGAEIGFGEVHHLSAGAPLLVRTETEEHTARAIVLATGLCAASLELTEESAFKGRGISDCAACDGPLFKGKRIAVAGGSEWAVAEAIALAGIAEHVTLVYEGAPIASRRRHDRLTSLANVTVLNDRIVALAGDARGLESIVVERGHRRMAVSGVFAYTGKGPCADFLHDGPKRDGDGTICVDAGLQNLLHVGQHVQDPLTPALDHAQDRWLVLRQRAAARRACQLATAPEPPLLATAAGWPLCPATT